MSLPIAQLPDAAGTIAFVLRLLLAATVTWLLAGAVTLILRRSSASLRHRVWSMSMAATLVLPVLAAVAPQWHVTRIMPALIRSADPVRQPDAEPQSYPETSTADSRAKRGTEGTSGGVSAGIHRVDHAMFSPAKTDHPVVPAAPLHATALRHNAWSTPIPWLLWPVGAWLVVSLWLVARQAVSLFIAARLVRRGQSINEGSAAVELRRLAIKLNSSVNPPLRQSNEIGMPICVGCLWPCILLPADHVSWNAEQLRATLTHELAHVVRRDVLWQMIARLACGIYWFHPLAWIAAWQMRVERELACDDYVLRDGEPSTRYARWLVKMADSLTGRALTGERAGVAMASPHGFQTRLAAILDPRRKRVPLSRRTTLLVTVVGGAVLIALAVVNPLAPAAAKLSAPPSTQPATDAKPQQRTLHLNFVDAMSGKPVSGVIGNYWPDQQNTSNDALYTSDSQGRAVLSFPATARSVRFFFHKKHFVEGLTTLGGEFGVKPISDTFTLKMQPGRTIGGIVQDQQGNGVAGAKLQLTFEVDAPEGPNRTAMAYGDAESDAQGRWAFGGAPTHPRSINIYCIHPEFVHDSFNHQYDGTRFDSLLARNLVTVIQRGVTVSGNVVDHSGKPIAGASVGVDWLTATTTDVKGDFQLHGVEQGARSLVARSQGCALQIADVVVAPGMRPVIFHLEAGHVLHGRVVDPRGNAVPGARVSIDKWRTISRLGIDLTADANGRFTWDEAPTDPVTLSVSSRHFLSHEATAVAGEKEVVLTLTPETVVGGSVVDDQTGKPIITFSISISGKASNDSWLMDRNGFNGAYETRITSAADTVQVRINVDGYLPAESPQLQPKGDDLRFDARMKKSGGMTGSVIAPDGTPAVGADVILIEHLGMAMENGVLGREVKTENVSTVTDAAGHFTLPVRTGKINLALFHASGWNLIKMRADEPLQRLPLRAWCTVAGVLMKGDKPWPDQTIALTPTSLVGDTFYERQHFRYAVTTDAQGRFELKHVIDGTADIGVELSYLSHRLSLDLHPGESKSGLQLGGMGRPVTARILTSDEIKAKGLSPTDAWLNRMRPPAFIRPPNWDALPPALNTLMRKQYEQTDVYQKYESQEKDIGAPVTTDGSVRFDDVPAGDYVLNVMVQRPTPNQPNFWRPVAQASKRITVPDMPGGRSDAALDAGSIVLDLVSRPNVGEMAPTFEPADFNNGHLKLSDYGGKYVLLDFWATWCGPCIAEFPHVSALHKTYANDPRLIIIGVSIDDGPDDPAKFLRDRNLPWLQAYGGPSAQPKFGIYGIPSVWLIGPDGKIIAKDIPAENLDQVVKKTLSRSLDL